MDLNKTILNTHLWLVLQRHGSQGRPLPQERRWQLGGESGAPWGGREREIQGGGQGWALQKLTGEYHVLAGVSLSEGTYNMYPKIYTNKGQLWKVPVPAGISAKDNEETLLNVHPRLYMLHCCGETVVTDLPALDLLLYGCLPWNVPLLQFIALLEYRWRLRGGLRLRWVAGIYRHLWLAVMTAGTGLKVQMCVFVGKQLQLYECKVNIFRVSIFRPGLIIPQDSSLTNLAPDSYQKIRIVAIFQRSASPLPARTLANSAIRQTEPCCCTLK